MFQLTISIIVLSVIKPVLDMVSTVVYYLPILNRTNPKIEYSYSYCFGELVGIMFVWIVIGYMLVGNKKVVEEKYDQFDQSLDQVVTASVEQPEAL
jgi:flagellar biosynthesis protein FliR